ncbi:MAG: AMP-binding protein [Planctomycetaceae bacterium]|nr:AMP-binding protein [Planctomycetaceae bacterium]
MSSGPVRTFAEALDARAREHPERAAVRVARDRARHFDEITYGALAARAAAIAAGLGQANLGPRGLAAGDRVALFVRPGLDLIAVTYALLHLGAVPVLIDPGMGRKKLLASIERMAPAAMVGVSRAHVARRLFAKSFRSLRFAVHVGRGPRLGALALQELEAQGVRNPQPPRPCRADEPAAVLFTSGSTGPPKGVLATHGNLAAQLETLRRLYDLRSGEVNLACFPLFALFDTALGMTSLFPEIDPTRPARCDPRKVVAAIERGGATLAFGSPAIWRRIAPWCQTHRQDLKPLTRILIAGAPVPPALVAQLRPLLEEGGDVHTPYGATECLPVSSVDGAELLATRAQAESGWGTCVGREAPGAEVRLVRPTDGPIAREADLEDVPRGELGEVVVRAPQASPLYLFDDAATSRAKIAPAPAPGSPAHWHRMGDLARRDKEGRLWFQGRHAEALRTSAGLVATTPLETIADTLPGIHRTALVGLGPMGEQRLCLVVEPTGTLPKGKAAAERAAAILAQLAKLAPHLAQPTHVLFHPSFPVDPRHNAKIHRLTLARWAAAHAPKARPLR